jgi:hypothetical protein
MCERRPRNNKLIVTRTLRAEAEHCRIGEKREQKQPTDRAAMCGLLSRPRSQSRDACDIARHTSPRTIKIDCRGIVSIIVKSSTETALPSEGIGRAINMPAASAIG